jgi:hypothetical protein
MAGGWKAVVLLSALWEVLAYCAGSAAQAKLGVMGALLVITVAVGVRANDLRLAVGATLVLVTLMLRPGLLAVAAVVVLVTLMLRPDP